jgi:MFS family permease
MFRWYWIGLWGLALSISVQNFALPWLAFHLTGSTLMVGLMAFCVGVPNAVLSPFGGVLADRAGRARVIRATQSLAFLFSVALAGFLALGGDVWGVMVLAMLLGGVAAFDQPARQAIVPSLVPRDLLVNAMALSSTAWTSSRIIGPAVAGGTLALLLAAGLGPGALFALAAIGYGLMAICMRRVKLPAMPLRDRSRSVPRDLADGFVYVGTHRVVATLFVVLLASSLFGMSFLILMPVLAKEVYLVDEAGLGLLVACFGVGGLVGTILLAAIGSARHRGRVTVLGAVAFGSLLVILAASSSLVVSVPAMFAIGFSYAVFHTAAHTVLQVIVPDEYRGRVMANYSLMWSFGTVGGAIMGAMAALLGVQVAVGIGGALVVGFAIGCLLVTPQIWALD